MRIGPYTYTLERTDHLLDDGGKYGDCNENKALIRYVGDSAPTVVRSVVLHEILHACALAAAVGLTEKLDQENFIRRIEPVLLGVLRDNPQLIAWLQESASGKKPISKQ